jgi:hypothetical protein
MENQHKHITGYRDLSQAEIDLMNEIKAKGEELRALVAKINSVAIPELPEIERSEFGEIVQGQYPYNLEIEGDHPAYWLRFADSSFRTGIMYAVRAVAKPQSY